MTLTNWRGRVLTSYGALEPLASPVAKKGTLFSALVSGTSAWIVHACLMECINGALSPPRFIPGSISVSFHAESGERRYRKTGFTSSVLAKQAGVNTLRLNRQLVLELNFSLS